MCTRRTPAPPSGRLSHRRRCGCSSPGHLHRRTEGRRMSCKAPMHLGIVRFTHRPLNPFFFICSPVLLVLTQSDMLLCPILMKTFPPGMLPKTTHTFPKSISGMNFLVFLWHSPNFDHHLPKTLPKNKTPAFFTSQKHFWEKAKQRNLSIYAGFQAFSQKLA